MAAESNEQQAKSHFQPETHAASGVVTDDDLNWSAWAWGQCCEQAWTESHEHYC